MNVQLKHFNSTQEELKKFNANLPLEQASTMPSSWYLNPEIYELERTRIFHNSWQCVGRFDQLKDPGSYITLNLAGEPIVVLRDSDNQLRCLANVCRHKAAKLACCPEGKTKVLQCRYHGWSYDLKGQLKGAPEFSQVEGFVKSEIKLPSYKVDSWGPFVFVHLGKPQLSLKEFLAPVISMHDEKHFAKLDFVQRKEYILNCNWKVFNDNYLDGGYHVNTIHPGLSGVVNYSEYKTELFELSNVQISPLKEGEVSNVRSGDNAYYWWLFPNFMLNMYEGYLDTHFVLPLGPDKCRVVFDFYFEDTDGDEAQALINASIEVAEQIQQEDIAISEDVQMGLFSTTYDTGRLSAKREHGIHHFHNLVATCLNREIV